jgi:hypothetical protein
MKVVGGGGVIASHRIEKVIGPSVKKNWFSKK